MKFFKSNKFYIFGAGSTAKLVKTILEKHNKKVEAFLTSFKGSSSVVNNTTILNISDSFTKIDTSTPVIIAVFNREKNSSITYITDFLASHGFKYIIDIFEFYNTFSSELHNWYWLTNRDFYITNINNYTKAKALLNDSKSIEIYSKIIDFLTTFNYKNIPEAEFQNQYFPKDIEIWNNRGAFLDIGSYDGQTVLDAFDNYGKLDEVFIYEPDPNNIKLINSKLHNDIANRIIVFPCGVWSKTMMLKFCSGDGESSSINDIGNISIQGVSIDETLINVEIGFIKMDIEGAEIEALIGSEKLIRKYKPTLAICLYHKPEHLYSIPQLIASWDIGYKFFIRTHGNNLLETVLYCTQLN